MGHEISGGGIFEGANFFEKIFKGIRVGWGGREGGYNWGQKFPCTCGWKMTGTRFLLAFFFPALKLPILAHFSKSVSP